MFCRNGVFVLRSVMSVGWMGEMFCCVVVGTVSIISSMINCDGV